METFSALLAICAGNSPVHGEFPAQRPVTRSFDVFFDLRLNKRFSKQTWGWWSETPSSSLWRHRNAIRITHWLTQFQILWTLHIFLSRANCGAHITHFYWHRLTKMMVWISNYIQRFIWDVITYTCPRGETKPPEVGAWINNYINYFT